MSSTPIRRVDDWDYTRLQTLAEKYGTPLYVTDLERIRENYHRLRDAFPPRFNIQYAAKANTGRAVLQTLQQEGAGVECASVNELKRVLDVFPAEDAQYTAVNPTSDQLNEYVSLWRDNPGLTIIGGAVDTIERLADRGYTGKFFLRANPGSGIGHNNEDSTWTDSKFGVPASRLEEAIELAQSNDFDLTGLHTHAGTGVLDENIEDYYDFVRRTVEIADDLDADFDVLDLGGGLGVPYHPDETPLDIDWVAATVDEITSGFEGTVMLEPGRYIVADAGILLSQVNTVKPMEDRRVIGIDAGMTKLARPIMHGAYHPIRNVSRPDAEDVEQDVSGPTCDGDDLFAYQRPFEKSERGDLLAIGSVGAYGYEMTSYFHSYPRPRCVVVDGERDAVSKEAEELADVVKPEQEIPWIANE